MFSSPSRSRLAVAVGAVLVAGLLAGCTAQAATEPGAASGTPVEGGSLVFADIELQTDFQVQKGFNYTQSNVFRNIADRLTAFDPESGEVVPWIASDWSINGDNTEFTFTIRPGVTFSDGTPLDAAAVKANLDQLGLGDEAKKIVKNRDFIGYASSEVTGEDTVVVRLSEPNADFLKATAASTASLVSTSTLALDYAGQADISKIVASGPFVFESQVPDQEIRFAKREDYAWPSSISTNQGAAHLDEVVFRAIPEVGLRVGAVSSGQADIARGIQPTDEAAATASGIGLAVAQAPELTANWAAFRGNAPVVSDQDVRRALQIGFDREALKATVLSDSYPLSGSVLNRSAPGFVDLGDDLAYDADEAERLLDEAGWTVGSDGIREKDGQRLALSVAASPRSVVIKPAFEFIESEWRKLGVELTNNAGDSAILATALGDPSYPAIGSRQFYLGGLGPLFSAAGNTNTYVSDDELNALFATERASTDPAARDAVLADIQERLVLGTNLLVPLWDEVQVHAVGPGVSVTFDGGTAPLLQEAWIQE
ncbi:ABC transporter substrate-binding protein [Rathayibacter caricis]|uniref:ABC transporter substrate-binding protein n=1 Tax=Rathayibacter caricis TaxID=110936 RepID=UPI001FB43836|nr:ABC transporter substrate-binding protein [Rathayibacter caricis]MCJ1696903.1 ABC transporter substrate-binding protein [Rathayibacter caricis]